MTEQEFWDVCKELNPGDKCPWCNDDVLEYSSPDQPWNGECLVCLKCLSTFPYYSEECNLIEYNAT